MQNTDISFRSMLMKAVTPTLDLNADTKVLLLSCIDYRYFRKNNILKRLCWN